MSDQTAPGIVSVTDRRTRPPGVLPRSAQTWLMVALALGILAIIVFTGRPNPPSSARPNPTSSTSTTSPERLRDYQDRLRLLDERGRQQAAEIPNPVAPIPYEYDQDPAPPPVDPLEEEKKRRDYDSLFATNIVLSRRPDSQKLATGTLPHSRTETEPPPPPPSLDEVAEAVIRATSRATAPDAPAHRTAPDAPAALATKHPAPGTFRLIEGTIIDTVLTNRLDGTNAAPLNCLVSNPVYSHDGQRIVIPAGARVLGESRPVQAPGETRLAVSFHRLVMPDGRTYPLDKFMGLNRAGDAGLRDRVNQHYLSTFGAAAAVGLITGLSQFLGANHIARDDVNRTIVIGGIDAGGQATAQVINRFLNRLPTITIREGHRVKVYLTSDLDLPAYEIRPTVSNQR
jgi:type IV secretory pathway VirB10-like protein